MKRTLYYCLNGESVYIEQHPEDPEKMVVIYRGKQYIRPLSDLAVKFTKDPPCGNVSENRKPSPRKACIAGPGCFLKIQRIPSGEIKHVYICESYVEWQYTGMGGSYYGAKGLLSQASNAGTDVEGYKAVSDASPLGKSLIGKKVDEIAEYVAPSGERISYSILHIAKHR